METVHPIDQCDLKIEKLVICQKANTLISLTRGGLSFWNLETGNCDCKDLDSAGGKNLCCYLFIPPSLSHFVLYVVTQYSKITKKCNFKSTKTHFLPFQKWQEINFCTRKKFKTTKNAILNFFLVQKLIFCHFWNGKKCVFVLLKLHFFSNFRAPCKAASTYYVITFLDII